MARQRVRRPVDRARVAVGAALRHRVSARAARRLPNSPRERTPAGQLSARARPPARRDRIGDRPVESRTRGSLGSVPRLAARPQRGSPVRSQPADGASVPTGPAPVVLTHDIDSPEGLRNLVDRFLPARRSGRRAVDELHRAVRVGGRRGARSGRSAAAATTSACTATITATSRRLRTTGERRRRLDAARPFAERTAPPGIARRRCCGRGRCCAIWPAAIATTAASRRRAACFPCRTTAARARGRSAIEGILELPLSMPRDGSLRFLGYSPDEIAALWIDCADLIARSRGVVVLLTHCERRFSGDDADVRRLSPLSRTRARASESVCLQARDRHRGCRCPVANSRTRRALRRPNARRGCSRSCCRHVAKDRALDVLDLGCGTGSLVFVLAESMPSAMFVGLDVSAPNIRQAEGRLATLDAGEGRAHPLRTRRLPDAAVVGR